MTYRTHDSAWSRTGYSDTPTYPGQQPVADGMDYPDKCHCGAGMGWFMALAEPHQAECRNGHPMFKVSVAR